MPTTATLVRRPANESTSIGVFAAMLSGNLIRVRYVRDRIVPLYMDAGDPRKLESAESLLLIFRDGVGRTRGEIAEEADEFIGEGASTFALRGLAKVLEDRSEFEVVAEVPPELAREKVFSAAAEMRRAIGAEGKRSPFYRERALAAAGAELGIAADRLDAALFADLKDENRMLAFDDLQARQLIERYNVALAQAVLLRSTRIDAEVRDGSPASLRRLFRWLKFHRLLFQLSRTPEGALKLAIDGPLSLFSSTNKYGLRIALFLPALLLARDFRLDAELRWGPKREVKTFHLESGDGLVSHHQESGDYIPQEIRGFLDRFRKIAPEWEIRDSTDVFDLGPEGVWVPDHRFVHRPTGLDAFVDIVGFWKRGMIDRLLRGLPKAGPERFVLVVSDRLKVDEPDSANDDDLGSILKYKDIPNAADLLRRLEGMLRDSLKKNENKPA